MSEDIAVTPEKPHARDLVNSGPRSALLVDMGSPIREVDIHEILERHHVLYEVRPYYIMLDQRPVGAPAIQQRIQAGFDVNLYCTLEKEQLSIYHGESARMVVNYFEKVAKEIQSRIGQNCTVEVIPYEDSLVLDTRDHLRPQVMLLVRISHTRGLDQPEGPPEEQALEHIRQTLRELDVREA